MEADFVEERQSNKKFNQEMLKLSLTCTKYLSVLNNKGTVDRKLYLETKETILKMMERNEKYTPAKAGQDAKA